MPRKSIRNEFPTFAAIARRRIRPGDLLEFIAVAPLIETQLQSAASLFSAIEQAKIKRPTLAYALCLDLAAIAPRINFDPPRNHSPARRQEQLLSGFATVLRRARDIVAKNPPAAPIPTPMKDML